MRVSINILLVRVGLVISVDREHGTELNHIASVTATHPVTQVGYIVAYKCRLIKNSDMLVICV